MARLPEIQYRRNVPVLRSAKMAELPNQLRNINAAVETTRGAVAEVDRAIESEAKMDAGRREQTAILAYQERMGALAQEYHSDRSKSSESFTQDAASLRREVFSEAGTDASGRVNKYLSPAMNNLNTQYSGYELQQTKKLAESRQLMNLQDSQQAAMANASAMPEEMDGLFVIQEEEIASSTLPAAAKYELTQKAAAEMVQTTTNQHIRDGNIAGLNDVIDSATFKRLNPEAQTKVIDSVQKLELEILSDNNIELRNEVVAGADLKIAMKGLEEDIWAMGQFTDYERQEKYEQGQVLLVNDHFDGMLARDQFQVALGELNSGKYDHIMQGNKAKYLAAATAGITRQSTVSAITTKSALADGLAIAAATGDTTQASSALEKGEALLPSLSESGQQSMRVTLDTGYIQRDAVEEVEGWHEMSQAELANLTRELSSSETVNALAGQDNGVARINALNWKIAEAGKIATQRAENPAGYVIGQNAQLSESYSTLATEISTADLNDPAVVAGFNDKWNTIKAQMDTAQTDLGISESLRKPIPTGYSPFAAPMALIASSTTDRQTKLASMGQLTAIFGQDASEVAASSGAPNHIIGALGLFETGRISGANTQMEGINKLETYVASGGNIKTFKKTASDAGAAQGYDVPYDVWGKQADELKDLIFTQAVGYLDPAFMDQKKPVMTDEAWRQGYRDIMGEKMTTYRGEFNQTTYTYTQANGDEVSPDVMTRQVEHLRRNGIEGVTLYDENSDAISWGDAISRGWIVPVTGSTYRIDMKGISGAQGWLTDEPGGAAPYEFDMQDIPTTEPMQYDKLRGLPEQGYR